MTDVDVTKKSKFSRVTTDEVTLQNYWSKFSSFSVITKTEKHVEDTWGVCGRQAVRQEEKIELQENANQITQSKDS